MVARHTCITQCSDTVMPATTIYLLNVKNFKQNFKTKKIDWSKREGKVHSSLPKWRKEGSAAPTEIKNRYAAKLVSALENGKVKLSAAAVADPFSKILVASQTSITTT